MITATTDKITLKVRGEHLSLGDVYLAGNQVAPRLLLDSELSKRMQQSVDLVAEAIDSGTTIYGLNTGFGGMVGQSVSREDAAKSQENLLHFLATGTGNYLPDRVVRTAMVLRANVLSHGCSGVRYDVVERLVRFVESNALPMVREHGSIGASGDLVPLAVIGRAMTGHGHAKVKMHDRVINGNEALDELGLEKLSLLPKEGLAIVNGTSFSSAVAVHCVGDADGLLALSLAIHAMYAIALDAQPDPFASFVQQCKPHRGQGCVAQALLDLLQECPKHVNGSIPQLQDRYSLRCIPQYIGPIIESYYRIQQVVETEMNAISDNPLIDPIDGRFYQSGNFLGQGLSMAMDDFRRDLGLLAKHLDVQIALLATPEFSNGLPSSLRGNDDISYNMGLKGLQITGNSLMPLLTWYGNPIAVHFPTHAEQYNQNINGLSWESANLAQKSVEVLQQYLSVAGLFAIQALDLRARQQRGQPDGRQLLGGRLSSVYEAICNAIGYQPNDNSAYLHNDSDRCLENDLQNLGKSLQYGGEVLGSADCIRTALQKNYECV